MTDDKMRTDLSCTCCLIDFDGTLANSLIWYNKALDAMYMGRVTDKHYIEHYKDFGDAYEIIPGSPWKSILMNLCRYLAQEHVVCTDAMWDEYNCVQTRVSNDIGRIDAMLKVAYDLDFVRYDPTANIAVYEHGDEEVFVALNQIAGMDEIVFANEMALADGKKEYRILVPSGYVGMPQEAIERFSDAFFYVEDVACRLEELFNDHACEIIAGATYDELAISPVIEFCREFKQAGGHVAIHSGSNKRIIETMMDVLGIADIFDTYLCSDMLTDIDVNTLGAWGYKTELIGRLLKQFPKEEWKTFVIGDTKGDAFGAYENDEPFMLVWRGYPADPSSLSSSQGTLHVDDVADIRQEEVLDLALAGDEDAKQVVESTKKHLIDYAIRAAQGKAPVVRKI